MSEIGQLFFTGINGISLTDEEKEFIGTENIGGVILFSKNFENPAQLAELVNSIQQLRNDFPLFIGVDQEGGRVQRFKNGFSIIPPMMDISLSESPKICFNIHKIIAEELKACGVNVCFSPVCDVVSNPNNKVIGDRSFGSDPEIVSKFISSAIRGLKTNGLYACSKHFPGHGATSKDSHNELPIISDAMEVIEQRDLPPFVKAVKSRTDFVMMGHLVVDAFDSKLPCTLVDKAYLYLRKELKFSKIIITDDMQMNAITQFGSIEETAVSALKAGADMLLYRDSSEAMKALNGVKAAMKTKVLKNSIVHDKIGRVYSLKKESLQEYSPIYIPGISSKLNTRQYQILLEEIIKQISDKKNQQ